MKKNLRSMTALLMTSTLMLIPANTAFASELSDQKITTSAIVENNTLMIDSDSTFEDAIEPAWILTKKYKVTGDDVRIRTGPGTSYAVVDHLYKNDIINVKSIDNGWAKFKYKGQWRYVSATYLKAV